MGLNKIHRSNTPSSSRASHTSIEALNIYSSFRILDEEWASELQLGLERYMLSLYEAEYEEADVFVETESGLVFCGCGTCESRELLSYIAPRVIKGFLSEKIELA